MLRNGMVWNIRKVVRYGDVFMILDKKSLRLGGNVLIDKVDVSIIMHNNISQTRIDFSFTTNLKRFTHTYFDAIITEQKVKIKKQKLAANQIWLRKCSLQLRIT